MKKEILMKHSGSSACDADIEYEIDEDRKVVTVTMEKNSPGSHGFFSDAHLIRIAQFIKSDHYIDLETIDSNRLDGPPSRPEFKLIVVIGEARYRARIVRQISLSEDLMGEAVVELEPI